VTDRQTDRQTGRQTCRRWLETGAFRKARCSCVETARIRRYTAYTATRGPYNADTRRHKAHNVPTCRLKPQRPHCHIDTRAFYWGCINITTSLMRRYANKQNWRHSQNSYWEGVHHYLVISLDLTQLSLHIKPCGCRWTFQKDGIRVPAGRDCQVVPGKHGPLRFRMILECHRTLTGIPPFVVVMEEGRYSLWRLRAEDDDDDDAYDKLTCIRVNRRRRIDYNEWMCVKFSWSEKHAKVIPYDLAVSTCIVSLRAQTSA